MNYHLRIQRGLYFSIQTTFDCSMIYRISVHKLRGYNAASITCDLTITQATSFRECSWHIAS